MAVAGTSAGFYRYVSMLEKQATENNKRIKSTSSSGVTWFTTDRYRSKTDAQTYLALPAIPDYRVGPIPADEMPSFDHAPIQVVQPGHGHPGGGVECATTDELLLFDLYPLI